MTDLNIIIPTLNEEGNVGKMIDKLVKIYPDIHITIVDDGSKDKTCSIVKSKADLNYNIKLIDRSRKKIKGLTISVLEGILHSRSTYFVVIDCDFQHPLESIMDMYFSLVNNHLSIGVRKSEAGWSIQRKLVSKFAILLGNLRLRVVGKKYKDIVSGFFGGRVNYFKVIIKKLRKHNMFELAGYKVLFDLLKYIPKETKVGYVYYDFQLRTEGESKIGKRHILCYLRSLIK